MYQALYRKYRPKNFDEIMGQKIVVKTLKNAIKTNKISHAYIFAGPRGTGKTSIAKIFAKTINCENLQGVIPCENCNNCTNFNAKKEIDIIEIDAASNNGVDEIRNLKSSVNLVPSNSKYKIYIIDEVHMLSTSAFNALLKTLEEPPKYVIFILATTELYKVPETIVSRCQNYEFQRISIIDIKNRLKEICENENITANDDALEEIAQFSNGGMRDAIGLLDQLSSYTSNNITRDDIDEVCGLINIEQMFELISDIVNDNLNSAINKINLYNNQGKDMILLFETLVEHFKNLLIYINSSDYFNNSKQSEIYELYADSISEKNLYIIIDIINKYIKDMRFENNKLLLSQLCIIKIFSILRSKTKILESKNLIKMDNKENKSVKIENDIDKNNNSSINPNLDIFIKFKEIRINNALANFNKRDLIEFKGQISKLNTFLNNEQYSSIVSILLDGEIKIKGKEYIVYVYKDSKMTNYFNNYIKEVEDVLYKIFNNEYKVIAINNDDWEIIKNKFNSSLKSGINPYKVKEDIRINDIIDNNEEYIIDNNDIDNTFHDIVKYQ